MQGDPFEHRVLQMVQVAPNGAHLHFQYKHRLEHANSTVIIISAKTHKYLKTGGFYLLEHSSTWSLAYIVISNVRD